MFKYLFDKSRGKNVQEGSPVKKSLQIVKFA
jgi:hypothetical protein